MKIRCDLHVNGALRKLLLVQGPNETPEHMALKLAAYLLLWDAQPIMGAGVKHPALCNQEFIPDVMALNDAGEVRLWAECGQVTLHKLGKLVRRLPQARLVVMKATEREALRLRQDLKDKLDRSEKIEILGWPGPLFKEWLAALAEKTEVFGEAGGHMLNVVINEKPLVAEFRSC